MTLNGHQSTEPTQLNSTQLNSTDTTRSTSTSTPSTPLAIAIAIAGDFPGEGSAPRSSLCAAARARCGVSGWGGGGRGRAAAAAFRPRVCRGGGARGAVCGRGGGCFAVTTGGRTWERWRGPADIAGPYSGGSDGYTIYNAFNRHHAHQLSSATAGLYSGGPIWRSFVSRTGMAMAATELEAGGYYCGAAACEAARRGRSSARVFLFGAGPP